MAILQGVTINNTVVGGLVYKGIYDASTNQPSLANAKQGDFYKISVAGVQFGEDFQIGDMLLINADMGGVIDNAKIDKVDNTEAIAELTDLSDVTINAPSNGEVLQYNGTNFVNATLASGVQDLDDLSDVTITTASNDQVLVHNGTNFVNAQLSYSQVSGTPSLATVATSGDYTDLSNTPTIPADLDDLSDVTVTTASNNQVLVHNGTNFVNAQLSYSQVSGTPSLATVATSGDYTDLSNTPTIPADLDDLSDVTVTTASNNQVLVHNGTNFVNAQLSYSQVSGTPSLATVATSGDYTDLSNTPTVPADLDDLSDVTINAPSNGEVLQYNGTNFVNATIASGGATDLDGLSDVTITSVASGDTLVYNGSVFENIEPHQNVTVLSTTASATTASANQFILIPNGHTASSLTINLPDAPAVGSTVTVARGGNTTSSDIYVRCNNIAGRIFVFDQLTPSGSRNDKVYIDAFTVVKFTLLSGSGASAVWYADFGLNTLFPVSLTKSSTTDDYKLNVANGSILQFNTSAGATGIGAFEDVALSTLALSSFNNDLGLATVATSGDYTDLSNTPTIPADLDDLSDVTITTASNNQVLVHNGTNFVNAQLSYSQVSGTPSLATVATSGDYTDLSNTPTIPADLDDLSDVTITTPASGQVLQYNGTNFVNATISSGGLSYSSITAGTTNAVANTHYSVNTTGGQVNIDLPQLSTVTTGTEIRVKVRDATNSTIITGYNSGSETIDGAGTLILSVQYQAVTLIAGSAEWEVI